MKLRLTAIILLVFCINISAQERQESISLKLGIPSWTIRNAPGLNLTTAISYAKQLPGNFLIAAGIELANSNAVQGYYPYGIGTSSMNVILKPGMKIPLSKRIDLSLHINTGYSLIWYIFDCFWPVSRFTSGFLLGSELSLSLQLSKRISMIASINGSSVFRKYEWDDTIYHTLDCSPVKREQSIWQRKIELGLSFRI